MVELGPRADNRSAGPADVGAGLGAEPISERNPSARLFSLLAAQTRPCQGMKNLPPLAGGIPGAERGFCLHIHSAISPPEGSRPHSRERIWSGRRDVQADKGHLPQLQRPGGWFN